MLVILLGGNMRFDSLFEPAETILRDYGHFMTAYQIGIEIQRRNPDVWQELIREYGEPAGSGAGTEYSWASQISKGNGLLCDKWNTVWSTKRLYNS